jgi:acyl-CoA thioester hydrolase
MSDRNPRIARSIRTSLRVRYPETDAMGIVHHTHYLVWFEIGRTELMRDAGYPYARMEADGIRFPVVEASCRYHVSARYDDVLTIETALEKMTRVSTCFRYRVEREADGMLLAEGMTRHAATDAVGAVRRIPPEIVDALCGADGRGARPRSGA